VTHGARVDGTGKKLKQLEDLRPLKNDRTKKIVFYFEGG
jgi:hypothetical protein